MLVRSYRDVAVDDEQLLSGHVELAAQLVRLPVQNPEALVIRVENGLQKLQLGLQSRNRHVPLLISGHQEPRNRQTEREVDKRRRRDAQLRSLRRVFVDVSAEINLFNHRTRFE